MKRFQDWAKREYSLKQRIFALFLEGILFVLIIPFLIAVCSATVDGLLDLPKFQYGAVNILLGLVFITAGGLLAWWTILTQLTVGRGTPAPMMPTQKLLVGGPFAYCRNPMTLGTFLAYLGFGVMIGSFSAIVIVGILILMLLLYLNLVEEKELEVRFGEEYLEYKRITPFLLPRPRRRK